MMKILKKITDCLPVSKGRHKKELNKLHIIIQGFQQAESQHSQIEMNLIQRMSAFEKGAPKKTPEGNNNKVNVAYG